MEQQDIEQETIDVEKSTTEAKAVDKSSVILEIFKQNSVEIKSNLEVLHKDLLFLKNAVNLVIGESKSGKTYTTIKSLVDADLKEQVIHLDFDRNADSKLAALGVETYHIGDAAAFIQSLAKVEPPEDLLDSLTGRILVIDSLQDLAEDGYDSNKEALNTMKKVIGFKGTGATVIVVHHVTLETVGTKKVPKVKGNATTITSKCDTTLTFTRDGGKRTMAVMNTRAEDKIPSGSSKEYKADSKGSVKGSKSEAPK